jgi:hypothetical protein
MSDERSRTWSESLQFWQSAIRAAFVATSVLTSGQGCGTEGPVLSTNPESTGDASGADAMRAADQTSGQTAQDGATDHGGSNAVDGAAGDGGTAGGGDGNGLGDAAGSGDGGAGMTGGGGDGGWPTPTAICGTSILNGPTSAPAGAVTLSPGASTIQNAIAAHPNGGTTYYLTAGTYPINSPINPNNNDTFIGAPGAVIDGSSTQQVAFGLNDHATGVTLKYLTIEHFAGPQNNGIVNQGQGAGWTIQYCTIRDNLDQNGGANGIMLGDNNVASYNCVTGNAQTGISSDGSTGFVVDRNEISSNGVGYEAAHPCGCSGGMKFFTSTKGTLTNNWIHDNGSIGLWIDTNNSFFLLRGNVIEKNENEGIMYEISYNGVIEDNVIQFNGIAGNVTVSDFTEPSIYVSESGGYDAGAAVMLSGIDVNGVLRIANNLFYDNADGVTLYQNASRCCGSQDGCSTSCTTLPLYSEVDAHGNKRWNTQNVTVSNNTFTNDSDAGCTTQPSKHNYCVVTGLFSTAMSIDQAIAFQQNNVFENNTYTGPWQFLSPDQSSSLMPPATWQAAPFNQDRGSVFH